MGRPYKMGLDYFTVDTDIDSDPKIMDLIQEGDTDAWTVYSWSLIKIFRESYYIEKDTLVRAIAWTFRNLSKDRIRECLDMMAEVKLIDKELYEKNIVTGKGIQKRYWMVAKNRTALPKMDYWLLEIIDESENNQAEKRSYDGAKPSFQGSKPSFQGSKSTKEKEKVKVKEKQTETETEMSVLSDESDFDVPSYNPVAERINKILENEIQMGYREYAFIAACADYFDERALEEAVMKAIKVKRDGKLRGNLLKYVEGTLRNWENGNGMPDYAKDEEARLAEQKAEYMRPGKFQEVFVDG